MNEDLAVFTAVYWWTDKISKEQPHSINESQLVKFREKLAEFIYSEITTDMVMGYDGASVWIYCDDYPCKLLSYAAVSAGISESIFPHYVDMVIESFDGGETYEVMVSDKCRQPYEGLYPDYKRYALKKGEV